MECVLVKCDRGQCLRLLEHPRDLSSTFDGSSFKYTDTFVGIRIVGFHRVWTIETLLVICDVVNDCLDDRSLKTWGCHYARCSLTSWVNPALCAMHSAARFIGADPLWHNQGVVNNSRETPNEQHHFHIDQTRLPYFVHGFDSIRIIRIIKREIHSKCFQQMRPSSILGYLPLLRQHHQPDLRTSCHSLNSFGSIGILKTTEREIHISCFQQMRPWRMFWQSPPSSSSLRSSGPSAHFFTIQILYWAYEQWDPPSFGPVAAVLVICPEDVHCHLRDFHREASQLRAITSRLLISLRWHQNS